MKLLTVIGARPQFIKAAIVSKALRDFPIQEEIIHTGQHYDPKMSQVFFDELGLTKPSINLNVGSGSHAFNTGQMLIGLEVEFLKRKPDWVLVYGDTNSTLAAALAAAKLNIPIAHVEAGQRSFDRTMPEEVNRVLTDHLSSILFCCAESSVANLKREGIEKNVSNVGDVMYDAFLGNSSNAEWPSHVKKRSGKTVLVTFHRASNTDDEARLREILDALSRLSEQIIFPVHPRTKKSMEFFKLAVPSNVTMIEPLAYLELLGVLNECHAVITDSGGLQKEAYYAGKPCVLLREQTEWMELVSAGAAKLAGGGPEQILESVHWALGARVGSHKIYGEGDAGKKIAQTLALANGTSP